MIFVSFVWHMHQPYYKDDIEGKYLASWVRLHASKDYLDMLKIAQNNNARVTFNLTPVLVNQILSYKSLECESTASLLAKPVKELNDKQKLYILEDSFKINPNIIQTMPKYRQLYHKKQNANANILNVFSDEEILICEVAYLLSWFGNLQKDETIKRIEENLSTVGEEEKQYLLDKQLQILQSIVPEYKKAVHNGDICLTTTPFYHPILPLLIDTDIARVSNPEINLPKKFSYKEDAKWHIQTAKNYMERIFESKIEGMWPSEGSVSDEALCLIAECGFKFAATDEQIIKNSGFSDIYKPYLYENNNLSLHMFFRDHTLSDKIGFVYSHLNYKDAVEDFLGSIKSIESNNPRSIVSIILDGENAWEYYDNNGYDFLNHLYDSLQKDPKIELVTPNEYLELQDIKELKFSKIWPGSWIGANFNIWIGDDEDNKAWDLLHKARLEVGSNKASMQELYKAQGSDWNWWYGKDHSSTDDVLFDNLFRNLLIKAYLLAKKNPPEDLYLPIKKQVSPLESKNPISFINPKIDGIISSYFEWAGSGEFVELESAMSISDRMIKKINYGFNENDIFLRVDFNSRPHDLFDKYDICIEIFDNIKTFLFLSKKSSYIQRFDRNGKIIAQENFLDYAIDKILELKISKDFLGVHEKEKVYLHINIKHENQIIERFPTNKDILIEIPSRNFEYENWFI
ncbi:MAG: glycoside hydrolase family 57 protein [Desulfurella sp.]|uniref:glycoside hydrolase family 57 protein n=1 Tax=Desulfurella TaxID=33001 RepID=UPI000CBD9D8A|nr:glycoside hydrolase family 57 protein [Desulfurella multipotens]PMP67029.1 MAG: hypothetical protein C0192_03805 [Desulfurella multipotens]